MAKVVVEINGREKINIDFIEIDPHLRQLLKYNFSKEATKDIRDRYSDLDKYSKNRDLPEYKHLQDLIRMSNSARTQIIHDDFLTYNSYKKYDLIVMNPPFSNGDEHLLKAMSIMENWGGEIRCILNAETIRNPYTNRRKMLLKRLDKLEAVIEYVSDGFKSAERKTDVEIAIIKISMPKAAEQELAREFYSRFEKAEQYEDFYESENTEITFHNFIERIVSQYDTEVRAGLAFIKEYVALRKYFIDDINSNGLSRPIIQLDIRGAYNNDIDINQYLKATRLKYWQYLMMHKSFTGKLTSQLASKFQNEVNNLANYDFTLFNVQKLLVEINASMIGGVKEAIYGLFDTLTAKHSYYPECDGNIHYFNGWKTNKAHKVGMKSIIPANLFNSWSWNNKKELDTWKAFSFLTDLEKTLNYLDGELTAGVDINTKLERANRNGIFNNLECKHFFVTLYKKGTVHIKFKNQKLIDRLNIFVAQNRSWLPPDYGYTPYENLSDEAKDTINSFQGEAAYKEVVANREQYLIEIKSEMPLLIGGKS